MHQDVFSKPQSVELSLGSFDPQMQRIREIHPCMLPSDRVHVRSREWQAWVAEGQQGPAPRKKFSLAIVGTRKPSAYGVRVVEELVRRLSRYDICIVSGGAFGIDRVAHEGALSWGLSTHAWLVGPIEAPSPQSHRQLFEEIEKAPGSALIVPGHLEAEDGPRRRLGALAWRARNTWIVAEADAVLVAEAFLKSGTWQSAQDSNDLGKPLYAPPGPIFTASSQGTNQMISRTYASPVFDLGELTESLVVLAERSSYNITKRPEKVGP
jgi:DNA processing protein